MTGPFFPPLDLRLTPPEGPSDLEADFEGPADLFFIVRVREGGMMAVWSIETAAAGDQATANAAVGEVVGGWWSECDDALAGKFFGYRFTEGR